MSAASVTKRLMRRVLIGAQLSERLFMEAS